LAYAWIAFYEKGRFVKEVAAGRPPAELPDPDGGRPLRMTSLQLYGHDGRAFVEQAFDAGQEPIVGRIAVPSPERAGTVPCHVLGWREAARGDDGRRIDVLHVAHAVEDGRVVMTPGFADEAVFARPRRLLHPRTRPFTWAAIYDHADAPPSLYQHDPETGVEASGTEIDRARLRALVLSGPDGTPRVEQVFEPGHRVIYRRRTELPAGRGRPVVVFLMGWQRTVRGDDGLPANVQHVAYVSEGSGETIMAGRFDEAHGAFYGIEQAAAADRHLVGSGATTGGTGAM
jgi:hypothetical protein